MGSTESDLTAIETTGLVLGGLAGILGGITAALGLLPSSVEEVALPNADRQRDGFAGGHVPEPVRLNCFHVVRHLHPRRV